MPDRISDLYTIMKDYRTTLYGGIDLETAYDKAFYDAQRKQIEKRKGELLTSSQEVLSAMGVSKSGQGYERLQETVYEPIEAAHATLDWERQQKIEGERQRRESIILGLAMTELEKREQEKKARSGILGKVIGGAVTGGIKGLIAGGGNPWAALAGAGLGAIGGATGGGGGGDGGGAGGGGYMDLVSYYLNMLESGQISPDQMAGIIAQLPGGITP